MYIAVVKVKVEKVKMQTVKCLISWYF